MSVADTAQCGVRSANVTPCLAEHDSGTAHTPNTVSMKSTKVQTLGTVALQATAACTDDASIAGLILNWATV